MLKRFVKDQFLLDDGGYLLRKISLIALKRCVVMFYFLLCKTKHYTHCMEQKYYIMIMVVYRGASAVLTKALTTKFKC